MSLELRGISLSDATDDLLYDVSAEFQKGMNVLVGPTLAGKTTLMRLMAGLVPPTEGQMFLNGIDITSKNGPGTIRIFCLSAVH